MNRIILLLAAPFIFFTAQADQITKEEANNIVLERMSQETRQYTIYAKDGVQQKMTITSVDGEVLDVNYKFWCYYIEYIDNTGQYIIVKESNGNLLEVNVKGEAKPEDLRDWRIVKKESEQLCHCIMDTLKGEWTWFKTSLEGRSGSEGNDEFKSVIRILNQNEDETINYEVFVADTLFYTGSFQIQEAPAVYPLDYKISNIKLPHIGGSITGYWLFLFLGDEEIYFWSGAIGPIPQNFYHYKKIREE